MIKVLVESPFAGRGSTEAERKADEAANVRYAQACLHDCFQRGEAPFASHLLYTQPGVLDDTVPEERQLGIDAGLLWGADAGKSAVYLDCGFSTGMGYGLENAQHFCRPFEFRSHPDFVHQSTIIAAYCDMHIEWQGPCPTAQEHPEFWIENLHDRIVSGARSLSMNLVAFLTMLQNRDWDRDWSHI